jgi:hypothetical protein
VTLPCVAFSNGTYQGAVALVIRSHRATWQLNHWQREPNLSWLADIFMTNRLLGANGILSSDSLKVSDLEQALGLRTWEWPGRCFEIARALVRVTDIEGRPVYGFWTGPVAPSKIFDGTANRVRHGWVLTPEGQIIDPTRFVFERAAPYVYVGPNDHYSDGQSVNWQVKTPNSHRIPGGGATAPRREDKRQKDPTFPT